jgi:hypothetical protein
MKASAARFGFGKSDKTAAAARSVIRDEDDEDSPVPDKEKESLPASKQYVRGVGEHNIVPLTRYGRLPKNGWYELATPPAIL